MSKTKKNKIRKPIKTLAQRESTAEVITAPVFNSVQEILQHETELYCIVDVFWNSPKDEIGIGWSL